MSLKLLCNLASKGAKKDRLPTAGRRGTRSLLVTGRNFTEESAGPLPGGYGPEGLVFLLIIETCWSNA